MNNALGIPDIEFAYLKVNSEADRFKEFFDTKNFLKNNIEKFGIKLDSLKFINWGYTEIVYVGKDKLDNYKTIFVGQPTNKFGTVKEEVDNLKYFAKNNPKDIVSPEAYYGDEKLNREMMITPYYYQARCISCTNSWGQYVPEPEYHFETFTDNKRKLVLSAMIAKLISTYNDKDQIGLGNVELVDGDFILLKELDKQELNQENVLKNMKLIAARKIVKMPFDKYIERVINEFSVQPDIIGFDNIGLPLIDDRNNLINKRTKLSLSIEDIKNGIELGKLLKKKQKEDFER